LRYDFGEKVILENVSNLHTVATLFKTYFKIMPTPLLTFDFYYPLLELTKMEDEKQMLIELVNLLKQLTPVRKEMLCEIIKLMITIVNNEEVNKMNPDNLATVIGVNIIRSVDAKSDPLILMRDQKKIQRLFRILIENFTNYVDLIFEPIVEKKIK
jgi:chimaerin